MSYLQILIYKHIKIKTTPIFFTLHMSISIYLCYTSSIIMRIPSHHRRERERERERESSMGNYRFRLSDMIPNAWFYKLRDMSKTRNHKTSKSTNKKLPSTATKSQKPNNPQPKHYYHYTTEPYRVDKLHNSPKTQKSSNTHYFPDSPRKSSKSRTKRKSIYNPSSKHVTPSFSANCTHDFLSPEIDFHGSPFSEFESPDSFTKLASSSSSCRVSSSTTDIIINMNEKSNTRKFDLIDGFDSISELELPPILTKPSKFNSTISETKSLSIKIVKEDTIKAKTSPNNRKTASNSMGLKLRSNSPRLANKKIQSYGRRSVSSSTNSKTKRRGYCESFAVVKSSFDPQRDFRDSMMEMIVENNIKASKDLEELLACYISLNSDEYHDLIVKAFEQIWIDMTDVRI